MKITDVKTVLLTGPSSKDPFLSDIRKVRSASFIEDGYLLPPETPGLGVSLTDEIKNRYPFVPGSGEWNAVPGKNTIM